MNLNNYNILQDINNENNVFQENINIVSKTTFYLNLKDITGIKDENKKIIKEEKEEAEVEEMEKEEVEEKEMEKEEVEEENYDILTSFKITEKIITYLKEKYIYRNCYDAIISEIEKHLKNVHKITFQKNFLMTGNKGIGKRICSLVLLNYFVNHYKNNILYYFSKSYSKEEVYKYEEDKCESIDFASCNTCKTNKDKALIIQMQM